MPTLYPAYTPGQYGWQTLSFILVVFYIIFISLSFVLYLILILFLGGCVVKKVVTWWKNVYIFKFK